MATDRRIGAKVDFIVYAGETWKDRWNIVDANDEAINLTGFIVGPLVIYKGRTEIASLTGLTIDGSWIVLTNDIDQAIKKRMITGYYFECPIEPPGGKPKGVIHGNIKVDGKGSTSETSTASTYTASVDIKLNALYNTVSQTFEFNPGDFSSTDFKIT